MTIQDIKSDDQVAIFSSDELHLINDALVHYLNAMMYMPLSFKKDPVFQEKYNFVCDINNKIADLL